MAEEWEGDRLTALITEWYGPEQLAEVVATVNRWLAEGGGAAIYRNHDLCDPHCGEPRLMKYGEGTTLSPEPPQRLPDFPGQINWRYQLEGTYRGEQLPALGA